MQFNPIYTGENSAVKFPDLDQLSRSTERVGQMAIRAEEMKLEKALRNEKEFLSMMKTNPVAAITKRDTLKQALETERYNNKWGERYLKNDGELSTFDKLEMQLDKGNLETMQNKILSNQQKIAEAEELMSRDKAGYWDRDYFDQIKLDYISNEGEGYELPNVLLKVAPQDFGIALSKADVTGTPDTYIESIKDDKGSDTGFIQEYDTRMNKQEAMQFIPQYALTNDAFMEDIIRKFDQLPETEQLKVIGDYNRDGVTDPTDIKLAQNSKKITEHPIMQWAANNSYFQKQAMQPKPRGSSKRKDTGSSKSTTFNWSTEINAGHNKNNDFEVKPGYDIATSEGKVTLPDAYDFSGISRTTTDPRAIKTVLIPDGKGGFTEKSLGETARFDIVSYSPTADIAIVELKSDSSDGSYDSGESIAVRGEEVNDLLQRKPFGIFRNTSKPTAQNSSKKKAY